MQNPTSHDNDNSQTDWTLLVPALLLVLIAALGLILFPEQSALHAGRIMNSITLNFGWLYLCVTVAGLIFALWLAFGRYAHVKLGREGEEPEYGTLHWVAMMFTAGIGAGLVAWGFTEPVFYFQRPPMGIKPLSEEAAVWAHMYPMFHWGLSAWALYTLPTIPIAYLLYVRKVKSLRISEACFPRANGTKRAKTKNIIDIAVMLGIVGGTATALGLGVPLVTAMISKLLGVEDGSTIKIVTLTIWTALFSFSAYRGLKRGIKILADINIVLAIAAILLILVLGPTLFILDFSVNSVGMYVQNFFRMSFWTDPVGDSRFTQDWTVFYWAWWLAYAAFIGLFFGRISRGRTIQQVVLGVMCWGSLGTCTFLAIAGGYTLHLEINDVFPVVETLNEHGMSFLVAEILNELPGGRLILGLFIVLSIIFYATSLDSAAFILASISTKNLSSDAEPNKKIVLMWAFALAFLTAGLVISGGLKTAKSTTVISSLPLVPIIVLMCISLIVWLRKDFGVGQSIALPKKHTE